MKKTKILDLTVTIDKVGPETILAILDGKADNFDTIDKAQALFNESIKKTKSDNASFILDVRKLTSFPTATMESFKVSKYLQNKDLKKVFVLTKSSIISLLVKTTNKILKLQGFSVQIFDFKSPQALVTSLLASDVDLNEKEIDYVETLLA